jgi:hypothetical protein
MFFAGLQEFLMNQDVKKIFSTLVFIQLHGIYDHETELHACKRTYSRLKMQIALTVGCARVHSHAHTHTLPYLPETKEPSLEIPRRSAARPHAALHRPRHHARSEGQKGDNGNGTAGASSSSRELWARPGMVPRMTNNRDR